MTWTITLRMRRRREVSDLASQKILLTAANKTFIARINSIDRNYAADFRFFRNFWFLVPIFREGKCPFPLPADAHARKGSATLPARATKQLALNLKVHTDR